MINSPFEAATNAQMSFYRRVSTPGDKVVRRYRRAMIRKAEYVKLKAVVPSVAHKKTVNKLTVIEEAIKYINELHTALATRFCDSANIKVDNSTPDNMRVLPQHLFLRALCDHPLPNTTSRSNFINTLPDLSRSENNSTNSLVFRSTVVHREPILPKPVRQPLVSRFKQMKTKYCY